MTKKEMYKNIITLVNDGACEATLPEIVDFCSNEIALLEKKAATPRKPTAKQVENEALSAEIVSYLTSADAAKTIKEMQEEVPALAPLSNQRISHILSALVNGERLTKSYVKKTPYFAAK